MRYVLVLALCLMSNGCVYTSEISKTKKDIERETNANFDPGIVVSMGPGLFHTAGWITKYIDDEDAQMASRLAYGVRRIKAGIYPVEYLPDFEELNIPELDRFKRKGWKPALKMVDDEEISWLMYRERHGRVHDLFVVVFTEEEMVLARLQGNLDEMLNIALTEIEEDGFQTFDIDFGYWFDQP